MKTTLLWYQSSKWWHSKVSSFDNLTFSEGWRNKSNQHTQKPIFRLKTPYILNLERNGTLKKQKNQLFLQKNQLTMNNFRKKMVYLQCCSKQAADMLRKQPCLVRTENLDNSLYTRTKTEVVHPTVYYCIHSASAGWVSTYTHWCELIFILCVQVVQNLQNRMKLVRTFFVSKSLKQF